MRTDCRVGSDTRPLPYRTHRLVVGCALVGALFLGTMPSMAQEYSLFDRFSIQLGGSTLGFDTEIRLDSVELGEGTTINFESDLGLDSNKIVPSLGFRLKLGKRHLIDGFWEKADRSATSQALSELQFGDITIPEGSDVNLAFNQEQLLLGYSFYFVRRDRWGLGLRVGARIVDLTTFISIRGTDVAEEADQTAPLPFVGFSFRFGITPKLRLISDLGWLSVSIGDVDGNQFVGSASLEYLAWKNVSFGGVLGVTDIDAEVSERDDFNGMVDVRVRQVSLFIKGRW